MNQILGWKARWEELTETPEGIISTVGVNGGDTNINTKRGKNGNPIEMNLMIKILKDIICDG